ncbi:MAG: LPP20 family lipoprotein [Planctomycetota bacterium]
MRLITQFLMFLMIASLTACGEPERTDPLRSDDRPVWVRTGGYEDEHFYGVGVFSGKGTNNIQLKAKGAQADANSNLAAVLNQQVSSCVKSWASAVSNLTDGPIDESNLTSATKVIVDESLIGARQIDAWEDKATGDYYVLIKMTFDGVAERMKRQISDVIAKEIKDHARQGQEELNKEVEELRKMRSGR